MDGPGRPSGPAPSIGGVDLQDAWELGRELMDEHGLEAWQLTFDRAKRRAGACRYQTRTISLSAPLARLHDVSHVTDTVLHEIAHALVGPRAGHGPRWRAVAADLGATPERCLAEDVPTIAGRWLGVCPQGHTTDRHRRPTRVLSCRRCSPRFDPDALYEWTYDGQVVAMHPSYVAELQGLRAGGSAVVRRLAPGSRVEIIAPGRWDGRTGLVLKTGRTRYHVRCGRDVVTVPFSLVEPV